MPKTRRPTLAHSAAPANALRVWCTPKALFIEAQSASGPFVQSYPITEAGLSKALRLIRGQPFDFGGTPTYSNEPPATLQEAHAEAILRRRGLIR